MFHEAMKPQLITQPSPVCATLDQLQEWANEEDKHQEGEEEGQSADSSESHKHLLVTPFLSSLSSGSEPPETPPPDSSDSPLPVPSQRNPSQKSTLRSLPYHSVPTLLWLL